MKTILDTAKRTDIDVEREVSTVLFTVISTSALIVGLWAAACIIGGLFNHGLVAMLRGYVTAVTGF